MRNRTRDARQRGPSLLELVHGLLRRTYLLRVELHGLERYVIGDRGYHLLYRNRRGVAAAASADSVGARTLVRETDDGLRACIYYPDELIRRLERYPPLHGLGDENVDAFAALVEELDHLLLLAERSLEQREVTLFELELQANVSKHLVLSRFLAGNTGRLTARRRLWLRHHLFEKLRFCDENPGIRGRYRDAAHLAVRFIDGTLALPRAERIGTLRSFHRASAQGKLRLIDSLL
jgi:hypothetical protein